MKRLILIAGVLCIMAMAGCEKAPDDAPSAAQRMLNELNDKKNVALSMDTEMSAVVSGEDIYGNGFSDMDLNLKQSTEVEYSNAPFVMHTQGTSLQNVDGTDMSSEIDMYQLEEDGHKVLYSRYDEQWIKFDDNGNLKDVVETILQAVSQEQLGASFDEAFQDKNSDTCTMSMVVSPEMVQYMTATIEAFLGITDAISENVSDGIPVEMNVDKKSWQVQSITLDFNAYGNALIAASGNLKGTFSQCYWVLEYTDSGSKEQIVVPDEVSAQAFDLSSGSGNLQIPEESSGQGEGQTVEPAKQNEQGEYEIADRNSETVAYVKPPASFSVLVSSANSITFENDQYTDIVCQFVDGYSADTIIEEYKGAMSYLQTDESYSDVSFSEIQTVPCGDYQASYTELKYTLEGGLNVEYFICIPVGERMFVCQIYGLMQEDEALVQEVVGNLSFQE